MSRWSHREGEPAPSQGRWFPREEIGPPECPILHRWTLIGTRGRGKRSLGKLLLHHFLPNADDRAVHDHPASFVTFVLRGSYVDCTPCPVCNHEDSFEVLDALRVAAREPRLDFVDCEHCRDVRYVLELMRPGTVRYRPAEHRHRTRVGPRGCWTLVVMGPKRREWGFFKGGRWWPWREHERRFGFGMRCPEPGPPGPPTPPKPPTRRSWG